MSKQKATRSQHKTTHDVSYAPTLATDVGRRIAMLRKHCGLSVAAFARKIGYHRSYIFRLENRKSTNPSTEFFARVISTFSVSPDWLIEGKGELEIHARVAQGDWPVAQATHVKPTDLLVETLERLSVEDLREVAQHYLQQEGAKGAIGIVATEVCTVVLSELRRRAAAGLLKQPPKR
jgi:transcriptional regulator with XRE-family HTH domain